MFHPREYLSYSQMRLFHENKEDFIKRYFYGEDVLHYKIKKYAEYGSEVHERLENEEQDLWDMLLKLPVQYDETEKEIYTDLFGITLHGKIDLLKRGDELIVGDWKTSKNKWKRKEVDENEQITFYCVLAELEYGRIPDRCYIHRVDVGEKDDELFLTGEVDSLETFRSQEQVDNMKVKAMDTWSKIGKFCEGNVDKLLNNNK